MRQFRRQTVSRPSRFQPATRTCKTTPQRASKSGGRRRGVIDTLDTITVDPFQLSASSTNGYELKLKSRS